MSWIEAPLPGRNGSSIKKPLPPLVLRSGTPPSARSQGHSQSMQAFLPADCRRKLVDNDRGVVAAAWSRKLPCGVPNKALRMVRTHLSPVEDAMQARHSTKLEKALDEASSGSKYLQTIAVVRRSRSVPAIHRHALEAALASHIVRARVELNKWHLGVTEINELRRTRNSEQLMKKLENWQFAEDDPVVVGAYEDIKRWKYIEEQMPEVLRVALENKDVETIRSNLKQLSYSGPTNVEGSSEARKLLRRYDQQVRVLREAITTRNVEKCQTELERWDYPEDSNTAEARELILLREELLREMKLVLACERVDGSRLGSAVAAWEFEIDNTDYTQALEVWQKFQSQEEALSAILNAPVNLMQLRTALDGWSFATHPECSETLQRAFEIMSKFVDEVRGAIDCSDGHALRDLLESSEGGRALGEEKRDLITEANNLHQRHSTASNHILDLVRAAPTMEGSAERDIRRQCDSWVFAGKDPTLELGRTWLEYHRVVSENSSFQLQAAVEARSEFIAARSRSRQQGLRDDADFFIAADALVATASAASRSASSLAFGISPSSLPAQDEGIDFAAMVQELHLLAAIQRNSSQGRALQELKSLKRPPELAHSMCRVIHSLLSGSSGWKDTRNDTSWESMQDMLGNAKFSSFLEEVPFYISTGRRDGITKARTEDAQARATHGESYSLEGLKRVSSLCAHFFEYVDHLFQYDDLLQKSCSHESGAAAVEEILDFSEKQRGAALQSIQAGLPGIQPMVATYISCGGDASELSGSEGRARVLLEKTKKQLLEVHEALNNVSHVENVEDDTIGAANARPSNPDCILDLTLQLMSGQVMGQIQISEASTGMQLKELIASERSGPHPYEQRLLNGDRSIRDHLALARQGIESGTTLTLVRVEVPLLQRLERLLNATREVDPVDLEGPGSRDFLRAVTYFEDPSERKLKASDKAGERQTKAALAKLTNFLKDASNFVYEVTQGKRKQREKQCLMYCERRIGINTSDWSKLPLHSVANAACGFDAAVRALDGAAQPGDLALVLSEFAEVLRKLYGEFLPLYWAWNLAQEAVEDAHHVLCLAQQAQVILTEPRRLLSVFTEPMTSPATVQAQLEALIIRGIAVAAPHLESLRCAAAQNVATHLANPDLSHPSKRPAFILKLLEAHLSPLHDTIQILRRVAQHLEGQGGTSPQSVPSCPHVGVLYQLMVSVFRVLGNPADVDWANAKRHLQDPNMLSKALQKWNPLEASLQGMQSARSNLLKLLPAYHASFQGDSGFRTYHQVVYSWASLAIALTPLLPAAQELAAVHVTVKAAVAEMKRHAEETSPAEAEEFTWTRVREALHRPSEPWWWLRCIGCKDPKNFHQRFGLAPDASAANDAFTDTVVANGEPFDSPDMAPAPPDADDKFDFEDSPPRSSPPAKAVRMGSADGGPLKNAEEGAQSELPADNYQELGDQPSLDRDPYSMAFDADGDDAEPTSPTSPNDGAYSQADFDAEDQISPNGGAYSQGDFDLEDDPSQQRASPNGGAYSQGDFDLEDDRSMQQTSPNAGTYSQGDLNLEDDRSMQQTSPNAGTYSQGDLNLEDDPPMQQTSPDAGTYSQQDFNLEDNRSMQHEQSSPEQEHTAEQQEQSALREDQPALEPEYTAFSLHEGQPALEPEYSAFSLHEGQPALEPEYTAEFEEMEMEAGDASPTVRVVLPADDFEDSKMELEEGKDSFEMEVEVSRKQSFDQYEFEPDDEAEAKPQGHQASQYSMSEFEDDDAQQPRLNKQSTYAMEFEGDEFEDDEEDQDLSNTKADGGEARKGNQQDAPKGSDGDDDEFVFEEDDD